MSVKERLPFEAERETAPLEVMAPAVRLPEPAVTETVEPLARTVPDTDEAFMLAAPEPPFILTVVPAETDPPVTETAPAVVPLKDMLPLALREPVPPIETVRDPSEALL